jgi:hypothetical protein
MSCQYCPVCEEAVRVTDFFQVICFDKWFACDNTGTLFVWLEVEL